MDTSTLVTASTGQPNRIATSPARRRLMERVLSLYADREESTAVHLAAVPTRIRFTGTRLV